MKGATRKGKQEKRRWFGRQKPIENQRRNDRQGKHKPRGAGKTQNLGGSGVSKFSQWLLTLLLWIKRGALVAVIGAVTWGGYLWGQQVLAKPVGQIHVEGAFLFVSRAELEANIAAEMTRGFWQLDLQQIRSRLQSNKWVDEVRIVRRWPDALSVIVIEHSPIARWNERDVLNQRGEVISLTEQEWQAMSVVGQEKLRPLPLLQAPKGQELAMMQHYRELSELLASRGLMIKTISFDEAQHWRLQLVSGVWLNIGRHEVMEKLGRFLSVFDQQLKARWAELRTIDLRYSNGVAVAWQVEQ